MVDGPVALSGLSALAFLFVALVQIPQSVRDLRRVPVDAEVGWELRFWRRLHARLVRSPQAQARLGNLALASIFVQIVPIAWNQLGSGRAPAAVLVAVGVALMLGQARYVIAFAGADRD
jgi:hypothetical protein